MSLFLHSILARSRTTTFNRNNVSKVLVIIFLRATRSAFYILIDRKNDRLPSLQCSMRPSSSRMRASIAKSHPFAPYCLLFLGTQVNNWGQVLLFASHDRHIGYPRGGCEIWTFDTPPALPHRTLHTFYFVPLTIRFQEKLSGCAIECYLEGIGGTVLAERERQALTSLWSASLESPL